METLALVFPSFNEEKNPVFWSALEQALTLSKEVILVDGGGRDGTLERASQLKGLIICPPLEKGRGHQLKAGYMAARAPMVLFHHPRSHIDPSGIVYLQQHWPSLSWGGFWHQFDHPHPLLKWTSWYSNVIRVKRRGLVYLDHGLFLRRDLFCGGALFPTAEIFEDTLLSHTLRKSLGPPTLLPFVSLASAIRFEKNGVFKQALLNQFVKMAFYLRVPLPMINKIYERGPQLNRCTLPKK